MAALVRQKWVLLGSVLLAFGLSYVAAFFMPARYDASARVMVPPSRYTVPGIGTEAELIRSGVFAAAVIGKLGLASDPEFSALPPSKLPDGFLSLSVNAPLEVSQAVIDKFQRQLDVQPVAGSYVLVITFTSKEADKAASVANALAAEYIAHQAAPPVPQAGMVDLDLDRLEALSAERARLSQRYGPKHPKMKELEDELASVRQQAVQLRPGRIQAQPDVARLVSEATPPLSGRRQMPSWLFGVTPFLGLLVGLLLAGMNEQLDRGYKTRAALEAAAGHKVLAVVPVPKATTDLAAQAALVLQKPSGPTAEAVRALRTGLKLLGEKEGRPMRVITVTSPTDEAQDVQARALVSLWLGRLAARAGEKVLVIDADLRAPLLHTLAGRSNTPSLVDYLVGQNYLEQVTWRQDASGAHFIFGSAVPNTALDLIGGEKMRKLSGYLRQGHDLVIYCAPACLPSAEALVLANESDQTLCAVAARSSARGDIADAVALFAGFGYGSLSLVMTEAQSQL